MTPSGPPGRGGSQMRLPFASISDGQISSESGRPPMPSADSSIPPADAEAPQSNRPYSLPPKGTALVPVFNPAARDGRIGRELPHFQRTMARAGYAVVPVETVAEEQARRERIFEASREVLEQAQFQRRWVIFAPYGGDGTTWQTAEQVLRAAGVSLEPGLTDSGVSRQLTSLLEFFVPKRGTAADIAVQLGSPGRIPAMPGFLRGAVHLPFWFPTVEFHERPGEYRVAGHSYSLGESGFIFEKRAENYRANPNNPFNRGLFSYFRLLPYAFANRYGLSGFSVHLRHFAADGSPIQEATRLGSEVIVTPNRIIAGAGGVPGAWGETKIIVLPPRGKGALALSEYIFRGLVTRMGLNLVGPRNRLRTLSAEQQWLVKPGEQIDVEIRTPNGAGTPLRVPAQLNGDVVEPSSGFTVRSPGVAISMLAHPNSLAVRLARDSALVGGGTPLISDYQTTSYLRNHRPEVVEDTPQALRVRTPFISRPRLMDLLKRHRVPFQRGVELATALRRVTQRDQLSLLSDRKLSLEGAQEFLETPQGEKWIREHRGELRAFGQRLLTQGVPLLAGIGAMFGAEKLADRWELDPVRQRELRFGLAVYLSHAATVNFSPLWEVITNRWILKRPYDFIPIRYERAAGEVFTQSTFESHSKWWRALWASWKSGALGIETGLEQAVLWRSLGLAKLPLTAMWNMGQGLLFSRLAEQAVRGLPDEDLIKRYAPAAAFFLPDVGRLLAPQSATRFFGTRPMRFVSRAFAVGFIGDLAFTALHRIAHGKAATYEQYLNGRTAARRRERDEIGWFSLRSIPRVLAPSLSDYIDSRVGWFGEETDAHREIRREDERQSALLRENLREGIPWVAQTLQTTPEELFGREIRLSELETDMQRQMFACRGKGRLKTDADFEETAAYLQRQFRAVVRTAEEAQRHLATIQAYELQQQAAILRSFEIPENRWVHKFFDERGRFRPQREKPWDGGDRAGKNL